MILKRRFKTKLWPVSRPCHCIGPKVYPTLVRRLVAATPGSEKDDAWQIQQFIMPAYDIHIVRETEGQWVTK